MAKIRTHEHQAYMPGKQGPFMCSNCKYYPSPNICINPTIIGYAKEGKYGLTMIGDNARVDPNGCSDEFERK